MFMEWVIAFYCFIIIDFCVYHHYDLILDSLSLFLLIFLDFVQPIFDWEIVEI